MRLVIIGLGLASVLLVGGREADARTPWGLNAASCVPNDTVIRANQYLITGGSVKFRDTSSGTITLYCPIPFFSPASGNSQSLGMTYTLDVQNAGWSVTAQVLRLSKSTGAFQTVSPVLSTKGTSNTEHRQTLAFTHTFDFSNFVYYVRVDLAVGAPPGGSGSGNTTLFLVDLS